MHPFGGAVGSEEAVRVWGQKVDEKVLYFPLNFAVNQKLLKKGGGEGAALKKRFKKVQTPI